MVICAKRLLLGGEAKYFQTFQVLKQINDFQTWFEQMFDYILIIRETAKLHLNIFGDIAKVLEIVNNSLQAVVASLVCTGC